MRNKMSREHRGYVKNGEKPKRTKSIKTFDKKLSPDEVGKEMKKKQEYSNFKKEDVGSMGGRKSGKTTTKTKPNTTKTRTKTKIGAYHKGDPDSYDAGPIVKGPKGQKQHWHDLGERTTKTKVKKKRKGTKVVTDDYRSTPSRPNPYGERRRTVTWK